MKIFFNTLLFALACTSVFIAWAGDAHQHASASTAAETEAPLSEGEVKKLDKEAGKLMIKHGPLENLYMPGMTMTFKVQEKAMLETVQVGDKIRFRAEKIDGQYVVTKLIQQK